LKKQLIVGIASFMLLVSVPVITDASTSASAKIVSSVSFRTAPSTSSTVLKYLKAGQSVTVLETTNQYWIKVRDGDGKVGYISSQDKYVDIASSPIVSKANAVVLSSVSFRTAPSTSGERIRYLKKDEKIVITKVVNSYWYAVTDSAGVSGYVSSQDRYVRSNGGTLPEETKPVVPPALNAGQQVEKVIAAGKKYLGTPYEYGSDRSTTTTFDCSDFVRQAIKDALGIVIPADSRQQGAYVREQNTVTTNWHNLKRGDLMFFMDYKGTKASSYTNKSTFSEKISHVGIYLGDGQVLHTYSVSSGGVRVDSVAGKHWEYRFLYGGSAL
jgi:cell wall-associated NlpC family hydrolase